MDARELAEHLKEHANALVDGDFTVVDTAWGYGDADFFVDVEDEGRFLISVVQVSE